VLRRDFNENDAYRVRISDPHLQQAPRFPLRRAQDLNTGRLKALVLGGEVADLQPERDVAGIGAIPDAGDFQVTSAEEEDEPRIVAIPEFTVDSETERVPVETSTAVQVGWSQQDPATEYVHTRDHAAEPAHARADA